MRSLLPWILGATLLVTACKKDESPQQVAAMRDEYMALIDRGLEPTHPEFEALAKKLESVPKDAKAHAQAQELASGIRRAQAKRPPRPLAKDDFEDTPLGQERRRCAELAKQLGHAKAEERAAIEKSLNECRNNVVRLEVEANKATHPH